MSDHGAPGFIGMDCICHRRPAVEREVLDAIAAERARVLRLLEQARAEFVAVSALRDAIADGRGTER